MGFVNQNNRKMMMTKKYLIYFSLLCLSTFIYACKDNWEAHNEVQNIDQTQDLSKKLATQANLSTFNGYVKTTGFDKILSNSQNYTVWAPTNAALATLDQTIVADPAKLKDFVANHIALTTYPISKNQDTVRVKLLNNKYANLVANQFEEATIRGEGMFVKNGVLHTIDQALPTKASIWDYMLNSTDAPLQRDFIKNLSTTVIDSANATVIGYNANGSPIFAPNPPTVARNTYWVNVADLRDEKQEYTYFMLQDNVLTSEAEKLNTYFPSIEPNLSANYFVVKDLTVKGVYAKDKLPDTLLSVLGVKVPINKVNVVKTYKASNGIVHVLSALPFRLKDKVPEFKIEGERPISFSATRTVSYRTKADSLGKQFNDIQVYDHRYAEYGVFYMKRNLPVVKYKVYARAIWGMRGDPQDRNFTQRYFFYNPNTLSYTLFYTHLVLPLTFTEVYCGEYTPAEFGNLQFRLTAANSTGINVSTLTLDYLRFEPVLP